MSWNSKDANPETEKTQDDGESEVREEGSDDVDLIELFRRLDALVDRTCGAREILRVDVGDGGKRNRK